MIQKYFYSPASFLLLVIWLCGCYSGRTPKAPNNSSTLQFTQLPEKDRIHLAETQELLETGLEYLHDSLWFEAQESFDSALVLIQQLKSLDSLEDVYLSYINGFRDTILNYLVFAVAKASHLQIRHSITDNWDVEMEKVPDMVLDSIRAISTGVEFAKYGLPLPNPLHPRILKALAVLTGPGKNYFQRWLNRMYMFKHIIEPLLKEHGMPGELIYLAMVESGFNPRAWSRARASGIWQFIRETGKRYGLNSDWWIDERRDPIKSTRAAIKYLKKLHSDFNDWHMAMAAYNCGEGRIFRQLREDSTLDYWDMTLPRETMNYVPKILAAMIIGENPQKYGFTIVPMEPVVFDTVSVSHCISFTTIAEMAGVEPDAIKNLNPELKRWCTPPKQKKYQLKIPVGKKTLFEKRYANLDKSKLISWHRHIVRSGQTLGHLAGKYGVSIKAIQNSNHLRGHLIRIGQSLIIPLPSTSPKVQKADRNRPYPRHKKSIKSARVEFRTYKVRRGDNLYDIAKRFNVSVTGLLHLNKLNYHSILKPGQILKISRLPSSNRQSHQSGRYRLYKIQPGDNLISIGRKLNVSVSQLKVWNNLKSNRINAGQQIRYYPAEHSFDSKGRYYTIKQGDNLWDISRKHGTSIQKIKDLNPNMPRLLKPGMLIRIK